MERLFGTDGIRGRANLSPVTPEEVLRLGIAFGRWLARRELEGPVVVGRDTRVSGPMLESALVAGLAAAGRDTLLAGIVPTPTVSMLTRTLDSAAGAVVSASHNPYEDNGVKFFGFDGSKLSEDDESEIEALLQEADWPDRPSGERLGIGVAAPGLRLRYLDWAARFLPGKKPLAGFKIACDSANGAAYRTTPLLLRRLGAKVSSLASRPTGRNINRDCGSTDMRALCQVVRGSPGTVGLSHDGDADRVLLCDERGEVVDGDRMLGILARDMASRSELPGMRIVATVMSNAGLDEAMERAGIEVVRTGVGDRAVAREMDRLRARIGGEPSGHLIVRDHGPTGDGLLTALAVLRTMLRQGGSLSELAADIRLYPQYLGAVEVSEKPSLEGIDAVASAIEAARAQVAPRGRVVVRYSGTEPLARVMVEGREAARVREAARAIEEAIRSSVRGPGR